MKPLWHRGGKLVAGEALVTHNREASVQTLRAGGQNLLFNVATTYTKTLHFLRQERRHSIIYFDAIPGVIS